MAHEALLPRQIEGVASANTGKGYLNDKGDFERPNHILVTQAGHGFLTGQPVYQSGGVYSLAQSDNANTAAEFIVDVIDANTFYLVPPITDIEITGGVLATLMETGHPALSTNNPVLFVSETEAGKYTETAPALRSYVCTLTDANTVRTLSTAQAVLAAPAGGAGVGASTFLELTDTFGTFTGEESKIIRVNAAGTGLEAIDNTMVILDPDPATNIGTPTAGMVAYDTTDNELQYYNGATWVLVGESQLTQITQTGHGFEAGSPIYFDGTDYLAALADNTGKGAEFVVREVIDANTFTIVENGSEFTADLTSLAETSITLASGDTLFTSGSEAGKYTNVQPANESNPVMRAISAGATATVRIPIVYRSSATATPTSSDITIETKVADYTVTAADVGKLLIGDGNAATVDFTVPVTTGKKFTIKATDITNAVTITPASGTIDGNPNFTFATANDVLVVLGDGTNLLIIS